MDSEGRKILSCSLLYWFDLLVNFQIRGFILLIALIQIHLDQVGSSTPVPATSVVALLVPLLLFGGTGRTPVCAIHFLLPPSSF
jgi:hypothetical protein